MGMAFSKPFMGRNDISTALGKKWRLSTLVHHSFPCAVEISLLHTKGCEMPHLTNNYLALMLKISQNFQYKKNSKVGCKINHGSWWLTILRVIYSKVLE